MAGEFALGCTAEKKKHRIAFPITIMVLTLAYYKYSSYLLIWFKNANWTSLKIEKVLIPIGISFVIFQSISYTVDSFRKDAKDGSFLDCFVYLSFFPKLVSGPIVLWKDFQTQLKNRRSSLEQIEHGIERIIIGYSKKVIIADTLATQISLINAGIANGGVDLFSYWLKVFFFCIQLYYDFDGYSDIAIGLCNIFGFNIKENFNYPYLSTSVSEFWRRWHISLGSWFREYVYIPLGGNRKGNVYINLLIVFLLTGIWHGTGLTFLIWGAVNGISVVIERIIREKNWYKKTPKAVKWVITMGIVFICWMVFMSTDLNDAMYTFKRLLKPLDISVNYTWRYYLSNGSIVCIVIVVLHHIYGIIVNKSNLHNRIPTKTHTALFSCLKRIILLLLFVIDVMFIVNSTFHPFLYFQF